MHCQAWLEQRPDQVESLPLKQVKFVSRGGKKILSQNKRWGANPFPCAAKQSPHSLPSKRHLIWFCCWSLRYPECFQDIYSCQVGRVGNLRSRHTRRHAQERECAHSCTQIHTPLNSGKHPEIRPQVTDPISQDTSGHVRQRWKYKLGLHKVNTQLLLASPTSQSVNKIKWIWISWKLLCQKKKN